MNLRKNYLFDLNRNIVTFLIIDRSKKENIFRLERWQNERLTPRQLGGRLEFEDKQTQPSSARSITSQTVWLKFQAEKNPLDAAYQLIRLRRKLGLTIQLPIHGPGGRQTLEQHLKNAENEQVI
jgi:hypothetical protein